MKSRARAPVKRPPTPRNVAVSGMDPRTRGPGFKSRSSTLQPCDPRQGTEPLGASSSRLYVGTVTAPALRAAERPEKDIPWRAPRTVAGTRLAPVSVSTCCYASGLKMRKVNSRNSPGPFKKQSFLLTVAQDFADKMDGSHGDTWGPWGALCKGRRGLMASGMRAGAHLFMRPVLGDGLLASSPPGPVGRLWLSLTAGKRKRRQKTK